VATHGNRFAAHGNEGVNGSSPSEGSAKAPQAGSVCPKARVVGVAFWDFRHNQTGVAPNAIELHPILGFACLSG
jgi:hypothetical protein